TFPKSVPDPSARVMLAVGRPCLLWPGETATNLRLDWSEVRSDQLRRSMHMQRISSTHRSLADAILSSTINHKTITPTFLTDCERICDPLALRAILKSAC